MPGGVAFELVDGQLVEREVGGLSSWVSGELFFHLRSFLESHPVGLVWPADSGFQCFPDEPTKVRRPDVCFVRTGRLPASQPPERWVSIAPDLVVEVLSPRELAVEVEKKINEYLKAGVSLVGLICPESHTVRTHRADGTVGYLAEHDELSGGDVIPGFRCRVANLFPPHAAGEPKPEQR
jgi:Uma2 family endonuclease